MKRITLLSVVLLLACLLQCGCFLAPGGAYSYQEFGPVEITGDTLAEIIEQQGCPDVIGGNDKLLVLGWTRTEGSHVLNLWSTVEKKNHAVLIDENGKVIAKGTVNSGKGLAVFGYAMFPVQAFHD
ncbi:MAG: hypothetical protein ACYS8W_08795 [Planctomycetota bacterium]|jgi:hypothetical protein